MAAALVRADMVEAILRSMRQPLLVLDPSLCVVLANRSFYASFKVTPEETVGQKIFDLGNGQWNIGPLRTLLETMLAHDQEVVDYRVEHGFDHLGHRVMLLNAVRMDRNGEEDMILLSFEDVTEDLQNRATIEADREFIEKIFDASRDALIVLGWDLRVRVANDTFYQCFGVDPSETEGRLIYELGNGQWDIPKLRDLLETILPGDRSFDDFTVDHHFDRIGPRTMVLNARRVDHLQYILLAIEDRTEQEQTAAARRKAEEDLRRISDKQQLLLSLNDALAPLADPDEIEESACRLLLDRLGVDRAYYAQIDLEDGTALVVRDCLRGSVPSLRGEHRLADFDWSIDLLRRGDCPIIEDTRTSPLVPDGARPASAALGIIACACVPLIKNGTLVGALCVTQSHPRAWSATEIDILREVANRIWSSVQAARADTIRRESDARLAAIFREASVGLSEIDRDGRYLRANGELARILGRPLGSIPGMSVADVTHPDDIPMCRTAIRSALTGQDDTSDGGIDKRYLRPDGSVVWANNRISQIPGPDGTRGTLLVVTVDLTRRITAEAAIRASEERFRQFGDASSDALWIWNRQSRRWEYASAAFQAVCGIAPEKIMASEGPDLLLALVHPDDRERTLATFESLEDGARNFDFRIRYPTDGSLRWLRTTGFALKGQDGSVQRLGGITHDMTEEIRTAERMKVLMAELQHRTRNLIGVIQAMSARTLRTSPTMQEYSRRFSDRLQALARVNNLLSRLSDGDRVTFDGLLREEMTAQGVSDCANQVVLSGPNGIKLPSASVQTLALAIHELLTNASKHGALSTPTGRLEIDWRLSPEPRQMLHIRWRESGLPPLPSEPREANSGGYGRELIERALPYQLGAETDYRLDGQELFCTVDLPLSKPEPVTDHG